MYITYVHMCVYICIYVHMYLHMYIYTYIYRERRGEQIVPSFHLVFIESLLSSVLQYRSDRENWQSIADAALVLTAMLKIKIKIPDNISSSHLFTFNFLLKYS